MAAALAPSQPVIDWSWIGDNAGQIRDATLQHLELTVVAVVVGLALSLPLAVLVWRRRALRVPVVGFTALLYTVPSIALFALLGPVTGFFSVTTAEVALVGYTLLILVRNILAGLGAVPDDAHEAARAMGYSALRQFVAVDLPLAMPAVFAGLRVATVTTVGLVTVTAFIGQGGLGQLLITGFQESAVSPFYTPILVGLVLSMAMAGALDLLLVATERAALPWTRRRRG
ncbi:MAG TPA: ABC transporter permease [Acidimicrobiales bacterium]|nr:ABC transporter permease [Acidimicrobiales bacterium]